VAPFAHAKSTAQLENIALAAVIDADPAKAERDRRLAEESLGVWIGRGNDAGVRDIFIRTTARDAIWFDAAVDRVADGLGALGDASSKDVRRGRAVGVLANPQAALDLYAKAAGEAGEPSADEPGARRGRSVDGRPNATLYVHVSGDALTGDGHVARVEGVGPIVAEQVREWLGGCDVTVKPVLDLAGLVPVDAYEVPDRVAEVVALRDVSCVFPWCTRPARRLRADQHPCDHDHQVPYHQGGPTCSCQIAPLCRRHHRLKTHGGWSYYLLEPGSYVWTSPHRYHYLRDHTGTLDITPETRDTHRRLRPPDHDPPLPGET
jgi:hypothetical protein